MKTTRTVYVYNKKELSEAIYEASNYVCETIIKYGESPFTLTLDGERMNNETASRLSKAVERTPNKWWKL